MEPDSSHSPMLSNAPDVGNLRHRCVGSENPLRVQTNDTNQVGHLANLPRDPPVLGSLPHSCDQADQDFNGWDRSTQVHFPPQSLRGPEHTGPSSSSLPDPPLTPISRKRKRTNSVDLAATDGSRPTPSSPDEQTEPSPAIKFAERRNVAYEIWAFVRAAETDEDISAEQWPDDYDVHLTKRPDATFVVCKFCTEFG